MATSWPSFRYRDKTTFPKVPFPRTLISSKSSMPILLRGARSAASRSASASRDAASASSTPALVESEEEAAAAAPEGPAEAPEEPPLTVEGSWGKSRAREIRSFDGAFCHTNTFTMTKLSARAKGKGKGKKKKK